MVKLCVNNELERILKEATERGGIVVTLYTSAVQRFYILGRIWLMAVEARAPCGDCNNNNNNNNNNNKY
jgi:hypothetical protein